MQLPREVLIGKGVLDRVGEVYSEFGFRTPALILSGPNTMKIAGEAVSRSLTALGFESTFFIVESPTTEVVNNVREVILDSNPGVVLGVGGGKVIDIAKLSSMQEKLPFISVPTAASHDGIASSRASLKGFEKPSSIGASAPIAIIADTDVLSQAPYKLTASGSGDVIAKYTAVFDWRLSNRVRGEYYGEYSASLALMSAKLVMRNVDLIARKSVEGIRILMEALISCGVAMSIAGSSRPCSGSEHLFSHALDLISPNSSLHGEQCGVGAIMMAYIQGQKWRRIRDKLKAVGAPTNAEELGVDPRHIIHALTKAHTIRKDRFTILGSDGLTESAAERTAKVTGVI